MAISKIQKNEGYKEKLSNSENAVKTNFIT